MLSLDFWVSLVTLAAMEVVLGIDNVVFLAILIAKVPIERRESIRKIGLALALIARVGLLLTLQWMMGLIRPLFHIGERGFSARDLILLGGGLFLMAKSAKEIHDKVERDEDEFEGQSEEYRKNFNVVATIVQIIIVDLIFSLDSVVTAVGMARDIRAMVTAMLIAVSVMGFFSKAVGEFVEAHPSVKLLALSFLTLIGVMLLAEGFGSHIDKGYIYFAMCFSLGVELLSMRYRKRKASRPAAAPLEVMADPREGPSRD
jgi:predicted tellurium resistance membrane protein TerC